MLQVGVLGAPGPAGGGHVLMLASKVTSDLGQVAMGFAVGAGRVALRPELARAPHSPPGRVLGPWAQCSSNPRARLGWDLSRLPQDTHCTVADPASR